MHELINEKVSVLSSYDRSTGLVLPRKLKWQGKEIKVTKLGYYHKRKVGRFNLHVFDVTDGNMSYRLVCHPDNLHWILEEVSDGLAT